MRDMLQHTHVAVTWLCEAMIGEDAETEGELLCPVHSQALERLPTRDVVNLHDLEDFLEPHVSEEVQRQHTKQALCRFFTMSGRVGQGMSRQWGEDAQPTVDCGVLKSSGRTTVTLPLGEGVCGARRAQWVPKRIYSVAVAVVRVAVVGSRSDMICASIIVAQNVRTGAQTGARADVTFEGIPRTYRVAFMCGGFLNVSKMSAYRHYTYRTRRYDSAWYDSSGSSAIEAG